ncbi:MAG: 6-carboxytetrahydropterin synthase QueD [Bacteroidia bacterium]
MHGHSFRIEVQLLGEADPQTGILLDFGEVKRIVKPYIDLLDHWCINDVAERDGIDLLRNPTSENLARWYYETLQPLLPALYCVVVHETCTSRCAYSSARHFLPA